MSSDLVNKCVAGDVLTTLGLVKAIRTENNGRGGGKRVDCLFLLCLDAVSVVNHQRRTKELGSTSDSFMKSQNMADSISPQHMPDFTMKDLKFIVRFTESFGGEQFRLVDKAIPDSFRILDIFHRRIVIVFVLSTFIMGVCSMQVTSSRSLPIHLRA